jgi:hypothetical protein
MANIFLQRDEQDRVFCAFCSVWNKSRASRNSANSLQTSQDDFETLGLDSLMLDVDDVSEDFSQKRKEHDHGPALLVGVEFPYRVFGQTSDFAGLFGFKADEVQRSSLRIFAGPETDLKRLGQLVGSSRNINSRESFVFYKKSGDTVNATVRVFGAFQDGINVCGIVFDMADLSKGCNFPLGKTSETASRSIFVDEPCCWMNVEGGSPMRASKIDNAVAIHMRAIQQAAEASKLK